MLILNILRRLFTGPIELLMEVLFSIGIRIIPQTGLIIHLICAVISIPVILLSHWADADRIRGYFLSKTKFKRSTILQHTACFLIPEILHFTAGFLFFNDLAMLHGVPFLVISDLGVPDSLIHIDGFSLNILPILVIVIHVISNLIQTRAYPASLKIQTLAAAILFQIYLYNSSAGFTLYWLTYELLHLLKRILCRRRSAGAFFAAISSLTGLMILFFSLRPPHPDSALQELSFIVSALAFQIPAVLVFLKKKGLLRLSAEVTGTDRRLFLLGSLYLVILTGIRIPSMVIRSAPSDFITISNYYSPFHYIVSALLMAAGTFLIWAGMCFLTAPAEIQKMLAFLSATAAVCGTVNVMFFGNDRGIMSTQLIYDRDPGGSVKAAAVNLVILVLTALLLLILRKKKENLLVFLIFVLCVTKTVSAAVSCIYIARDLSISRKTIASVTQLQEAEAPQPEGSETRLLPEIPLSADGRNVVVIMMDRSIGYFLPFLMEERPGLREQFDGFTFYPNTVSFGSKTNEGSPALFGGYEYTPERINERSDQNLAEKHNEALRLMPVLFGEAGYRVTVIDPPYAGYQTISDLNIYSDHPEIKAWHAESMLPLADEFYETEVIMNRNRNFFCYSIYRISPLLFQPTLYSKGSYNKAETLQSFDDMLTADRDLEGFQKAYNVLVTLPAMTVIEDSGNTFFLMDNRTTHEPTLLQLPDYTLTDHVDNTAFETIPITRTAGDGRILRLDNVEQETHYHVNMAAFIALGSWLDHLKENHVYDNTRIIIVSDHGHPLGYDEFRFGSESYEEVLTFNPILMVKDFGSSGFSVDERFMTNADTPVIAFDGLIEDPVNPATGQPVTDEDKFSRDILIKHTEIWDIQLNNGDDFLPGDWYRLHGYDIFDTDQWEFAGRY